MKSGYHFVNFSKNNLQGVPSTSCCYDMWKKIWELNVPPKVRVFFWRMCNRALPTCIGLRWRIESISELCPRCGVREESVYHAIRGCGWAVAAWQEAGLER